MTTDSLTQLSPAEKRALLKRLLAEQSANGAGTYPLGHGQQALWFLQKLRPEMCAYNVALAIRLRPPLDLAVFQRSVDQLVARHPGLRTVFPEQDKEGSGHPVQRVLPQATIPLRVIAMHDQTDADVYAAVCAEYQRPFRLDEPLASVSVYRRQHEDIVLINVHHLVYDARSVQVLFEDLRLIYEAESAGGTPDLPPLPARYQDFVSWQTAMLSGAPGERLWNYWSDVLASPPPALEIVEARPRPPMFSFRGTSIPFTIDPHRTTALSALAKSQQTTLYTILLAAMQVMLHQFSGQTDITIGTPVSLRTRREWSNIVGYFINMLPVRGTIATDETFSGLLGRTRQAALGALDHQDFPFPLMVDRLKIRREMNRSPLFQAMLNVLVSLQSYNDLSRLSSPNEHQGMRFGASALTPYPIPQQEGQFEIVIEVIESEGALQGNLKYQTDLYSPETAQRMVNAYCAILDAVVANLHVRIAELIGVDRDDFEI
jgi:hypothetical protein